MGGVRLRFATCLAALAALAACGGDESPSGGGSSPPTGAKTATWIVRVTDRVTGEPIRAANIVGYRTETGTSEVTPSQDHVAPDGVHRYSIPPFRGRVRLAAEGHTETWSEPIDVAPGETKSSAVAMAPLARIVVEVVAVDGSKVNEGVLFLTGADGEVQGSLTVKDGVADSEWDAGTYRLVVDPDGMKGFAPQDREVVLAPGKRTDLRLELVRP
jgi:hypothetical protein